MHDELFMDVLIPTPKPQPESKKNKKGGLTFDDIEKIWEATPQGCLNNTSENNSEQDIHLSQPEKKQESKILNDVFFKQKANKADGKETLSFLKTDKSTPSKTGIENYYNIREIFQETDLDNFYAKE